MAGANRALEVDFYIRTNDQMDDPSGEVAVSHHLTYSVTSCYIVLMLSPSFKFPKALMITYADMS